MRRSAAVASAVAATSASWCSHTKLVAASCQVRIDTGATLGNTKPGSTWSRSCRKTPRSASDAENCVGGSVTSRSKASWPKKSASRSVRIWRNSASSFSCCRQSWRSVSASRSASRCTWASTTSYALAYCVLAHTSSSFSRA